MVNAYKKFHCISRSSFSCRKLKNAYSENVMSVCFGGGKILMESDTD